MHAAIALPEILTARHQLQCCGQRLMHTVCAAGRLKQHSTCVYHLQQADAAMACTCRGRHPWKGTRRVCYHHHGVTTRPEAALPSECAAHQAYLSAHGVATNVLCTLSCRGLQHETPMHARVHERGEGSVHDIP
jgi:hypothetical protein